jgi:hypothetical protein
MGLARIAKYGEFVVVGTDAFPWPHEDYVVADNVPTLEEAKKYADAEAGPMSYAVVYDDQGRQVYLAECHE